MTKQEILNRVVAHVREDGRPSLELVKDDPSCRYLGPDGARCFVGILLQDLIDNGTISESEVRAVEGDSVVDLPEKMLSGLLDNPSEDNYFLEAIQMAHDGASYKRKPDNTYSLLPQKEFRTESLKRLRAVALCYGLVFPEQS